MTGTKPRDTGSVETGYPAIGTEIERKFLLRDTGIVSGLSGTPLVQGYFADIDGWSVRLRTAAARDSTSQAWLTLKSKDKGVSRREIEAAVPYDFASQLLAALPPDRLVSKIRYRLPQQDAAGAGLVWEIDRFLERHHGLWLAEIELPRADYPLVLPTWLGPEVTDDPRYRNAALAQAADPSPLRASGPPAAPLPAPAELQAAVRRLLAESTGMPAGAGSGIHAGA